MSCRGECTGRQGSHAHARTCVDRPRPTGHRLTVTDVPTAINTIGHRYTCTCGDYGMTDDLLRLHMQHPERNATTAERKRRPVLQVIATNPRFK